LGQLLDAPARLQAHTVLVEAYRTPADLIIMANDGTRGNEVLDLLGVPRERYRFYMNGVVKDDVYRPEVDVAAIRRRHGIGEDEAFILYTGRFFYWKRIDRHLEVLARVAKRFDRFKAVFIGDGPEMDGVRALCRERGLQDRALFLGAMTHDQVMNYLNACDVYISFHDLTNLCNPAIEACVCGKCIVTSAVGGTTDLLTDGVNAAVVEPHDDVAAITEALLRVLEDPKERARLAQGAKRRGRDLKTWEERMVMEVAEVEKMLASRS
jgi:glycosyltransferase involved in cell wall biosynthesis